MLQVSDNPQTAKELHPQGQTRIKAAAKLVGVHHQTLRRWWKKDKFPKPIDINGILLFKNSDLLDWLASHKPCADNNQVISATQTTGA
jgi:predicted DNA-binding transcriptional regulator AlpA